MTSKLRNIGFLLLFIGLFSCEKAHLGDCFKSAGEKTTEFRNLPDFHRVNLHDNVNLVIEQGYETNCVVEAGKNLLKGITTEVSEFGVLEIRNGNECNWVRSYDQPLTVYLRVQHLDTLEYKSIGNVSMKDTLFQDRFVVNLYEGAGKLDLLIHANAAQIGLHYGTQELLVSGICGMVYAYSSGFGVVDLRDLQASLLYVSNVSSNHMYVRSSSVLDATIKGLGNIYYYDDPEISLNKIGQGNLIHVN